MELRKQRMSEQEVDFQRATLVSTSKGPFPRVSKVGNLIVSGSEDAVRE